MNKYQDLLLEWCDYLVSVQVTDEKSKFFGGFACESCGIVHGRADNAVYPLTLSYVLTGDKKYLTAVENLVVFRKKMTKLSGAVQNDFTSKWKGVTAFSAINLLKTLNYFGDKIPSGLKNKIEKCAKKSARWVRRHMTVGFSANINYYCAAALVDALYYKRYGDEKYKKSAKKIIDYCLELFTENGLLSGEAKPHDKKSPRGCLPIDIGYIAEESMPCLIHATTLLGEEKTLSFLTECARKQLDFLLPDGGLDNSFGVRNNKWTYYGSRTSDGCVGLFCELAKKDDLFTEAAERTYSILKKCTHEGKLFGGVQYYENGQKACVHHTFCHACALADAVIAGVPENAERKSLPSEEEEIGYKYYPEIDVYKIRAGKYLATLTGYDYAAYTYGNGAAHAGGGTLSLLYKSEQGPLIAGSVYAYFPTEKNNMQLPVGDKKHSSLLVRAEYEKGGKKYATCLDKDPEITVRAEDGVIVANVRARFFCAETQNAESELIAEFTYRFTPEGVTVKVNKINGEVSFILPVIENTGEVVTENRFGKEKIFFLTGGFSADEYSFSLEEDVVVTIK